MYNDVTAATVDWASMISPRSGRLWPASLVVFSGHAKLPRESVAGSIHETLTIAVAVEQRYGVIVQTDVTLVTQPAKDFVHCLLVGVSLNDPPEPVLDYLTTYYHGGAKKALLAGVRDLFDRWREIAPGRP